MDVEKNTESAKPLSKDDIIDYGTKLKGYKELGSKQTATLLSQLLQCNFTFTLLKETKLHKIVPTLKDIGKDSNEDENVIKLSKELIKRMKVAYENEKKPMDKSKNGVEEKTEADRQDENSNKKEDSNPFDENKTKGTANKPEASKAAPASQEITALPKLQPAYRNGVLMLIYKTLEDNSRKSVSLSVSVEIEENLFRHTAAVEKTYKNEARRRLEFLKNKSNVELKDRLLTAEVTPTQFIESDEKDLMSGKLRESLRTIEKEMLDSRLSNWKAITSKNSGMYPCKKCKSVKTHTSQQQTRSADEPMTTFVTCLDCSASYKF